MTPEEFKMFMYVGVSSAHDLQKHSVKNTNLFRGIYFLFDQSKLVYVGISRNITKRIEQHKKEGIKIFDQYAYYLTPSFNEQDLKLLERTYIQTQQPRYNVQGT